jgi:AraC-like DNA-binding protein
VLCQWWVSQYLDTAAIVHYYFADTSTAAWYRHREKEIPMFNGEGMAGEHERHIVRSVVEYVENNFASSISLRDVAQALGYSPSHLTHTFSSLTGTPITAWIIKRRLSAAKELLADTSQKVSRVCEAVGFRDPCYFSRQFARHVGLTPAQFRSAHRSRKEPSAA